MEDINNYNVTGRLTRDIELKYLNSGTAVGSFSIAVNRSVKQSDGNWGEETSFFDVTLFGKRAEGLQPYLTKGKFVTIQGYLKQERWQTQEGQNRSKIAIVCEKLALGGSGNGNSQQNFNQGYQQNYQQQQFQQANYQQPQQFQQMPQQPNYQQPQYAQQFQQPMQQPPVQQPMQQGQGQFTPNQQQWQGPTVDDYPEDIPF